MDKKEIIDIAKNEGLDLAEDVAVDVVKTALQIIRTIVPKLSAGAGKMVNFFLDAYEDEIFKLLDEIDGKKDN